MASSFQSCKDEIQKERSGADVRCCLGLLQRGLGLKSFEG